ALDTSFAGTTVSVRYRLKGGGKPGKGKDKNEKDDKSGSDATESDPSEEEDALSPSPYSSGIPSTNNATKGGPLGNSVSLEEQIKILLQLQAKQQARIDDLVKKLEKKEANEKERK